MSPLAPLLEAPLLIQIHAKTAILAVALGPLALFRQRRDRWHRLTGYVWTGAMAVTALSSFGIHGLRLIGPFGPIHALSVLTLVSLVFGVRAAIRGDIVAHRQTMRSLYLFALVLAGIFTLLPGRLMNRVLAGGSGEAGWLPVIGLLGGLALGLVALRRGGERRRRKA